MQSKNGGFPLLMLVDQRAYTFQEPLILIALPPLTFQGVYVIQSNLCQSQSLGASELRITNLGSLAETWRSRKGAKNHDPTSAFWNAWWMCFFSCFKGFMIHEGKEWMASDLWTDICPYVCFENLVIWDPQIRPKNGSTYIRVNKIKKTYQIRDWLMFKTHPKFCL